MSAEGQRVVASAREACSECPLVAMCALAPLSMLTEGMRGPRKRHPHSEVLSLYLDRLRRDTEQLERELLESMSGADEPLALVAGCLLAEAFFDEPKKLVRLLSGITTRGADDRALTGLEEQLVRAAAMLQEPSVPQLLRGRYKLKRGDREVTTYEAVRLVTRLLGGETAADWYTDAVQEGDRGSFEASFVLREKAGGGDESGGFGVGALDLFFTARTQGKSSVFYFRRNAEGKQTIVPIESVRPDSLLARLFKVFHSDRLKTHRLFAKIARFLNNGFRGIDKRALWDGLTKLEAEEQIVLTLYAPRLGKYIEKRAKFPGLYRLSKFLHKNVEEKERKGKEKEPADETPAHAKIFALREQTTEIIELYGKETFKRFCTYVFRIAEATPQGPQWSDLIFKIGEVAYYLTAIEGFNPAGLEMGLIGKNAMAYIAYGMQPVGKDPPKRLRRLKQAQDRLHRLEDSDLKKKLLAACDLGLKYMALRHGFDGVTAMEKELQAAPA